ncbi:MAG: nucleotidyltransferase domain-containing protein [Bacteroidales bacterium]|nr:nucleotidyltransferase domain-containing protein [Bacteroidales bacterium]MBR5700777.1 nucleotidyltransferase domain-containing protein [Bacteroidales bacterium]
MRRYGFLKELRQSRGMTQTQVGILAGMSKSQISRMENGTLGSPDTVDKVLASLGYEMVIDFRDVMPQNMPTAERILSMLKVYYLCNKDRLGIEKIGLFGSFARGEETLDSDIDIVIALKQPSLFLYAEIAGQLKNVFGRKIDLVSAKAHMTESFKAQLEKEAIYVS